MKEEGEGGGAEEIEGQRVLLVEADRGKRRGGGVGCVGGEPVVEIALCDVGKSGVELDADDLMEGKLAGDEHCPAFACSEVDEGVVVEGMGWVSGAPVVDESAEDARCDSVVGGDMRIVWVASDEIAGG